MTPAAFQLRRRARFFEDRPTSLRCRRLDQARRLKRLSDECYKLITNPRLAQQVARVAWFDGAVQVMARPVAR
jgi:hypothetical protein